MEYLNRKNIKVDENTYRLYPHSINYTKDDGSFAPIDTSFEGSSSTIGSIRLARKNVMSVGVRTDNNKTKYMGLRPDYCQDGSKQIEFSLANVYLDGNLKTINMDNDFEIKVMPSGVLKMYKTSESFKTFKIEYDISLKGVSVVNNKVTEDKTISNYDFNITDLGDETGANIYNAYNTLSNQSLNKDYPYIDIHIAKISDSFITKGEYTDEEEFGSADLSDYNISKVYECGSSVYLKDSLVMYCKGVNFAEFSQVMIDSLCSIYNMEFYDDGGSGKYFTINDKKVGGIAANSDTEFLAFFNTKDIPNDIKNLFIKKSFNSTSFIDKSLSDFKSELTNHFTCSDLKIDIDTDYYDGDIFSINVGDGNYILGKPIVMDKDYNPLEVKTEHTLKDNGDGTYRYTKYISPLTAFSSSLSNVAYIDANCFADYDNSYIGQSKQTASGSSAMNCETFLTSDRNLATGVTANALGTTTHYTKTYTPGLSQVGVFGYSFLRQISSGQSGTTYTNSLNNYHLAYDFDTSSVSSCTSATLKVDTMPLGGGSNPRAKSDVGGMSAPSNLKMRVLKSTIDYSTAMTSIPYYSNALWNDFDGFTTNWDEDDVTEYSDAVDLHIATSSAQNLEEVDLNSDAISDINSGSLLKTYCVPELYYGGSSSVPAGLTSAFNSTTATGFHYYWARTQLYYTESDATQGMFLEASTASAAPTDNTPLIGTTF